MTGDPSYRSGTHPDVVGECLEYWRKGWPWTVIRSLRVNTDGSDNHLCRGCQGKATCTGKATHVQYSTSLADPAYYCVECSALQRWWDESFYREAKPTPEWLLAELERQQNRGKDDEEPVQDTPSSEPTSIRKVLFEEVGQES